MLVKTFWMFKPLSETVETLKREKKKKKKKKSCPSKVATNYGGSHSEMVE